MNTCGVTNSEICPGSPEVAELAAGLLGGESCWGPVGVAGSHGRPTTRLYREPVPCFPAPAASSGSASPASGFGKAGGLPLGTLVSHLALDSQGRESFQPGSSLLAWASARLGVRRGGKSEALLPSLLRGHSQAFCSAAVLKFRRWTPEPSQSCF